jgi:hypothetical protein
MDIIEALRDLLTAYPGNLIVRGSVGRGEKHPQDVDMIVLSEESGLLAPGTLPRSIHGLDISYVQFSVSDLPEYFTTRLRPGNDAFESIPVRISDPDIARAFDGQREAFIQRHIPHYVLYLWLEDKIVEHHYRLLPPIFERRYYKSVPGSKRSMLRYYWIARCLSSDFTPRNFNPVVRACESKGLLPRGFFEIYESVTANLHLLTIGRDFHDRAAAMVQWRDEVLWDLICRFVQFTVEPEYLQLVCALTDRDATPAMLASAYETSMRYGSSDRQWTMWFGLAAHPRTPADILVRIYKSCSGRVAYKDVIRNLVRNIAFPLATLDEEKYANDEDVQWFKFERQQIHHAGVRTDADGGGCG